MTADDFLKLANRLALSGSSGPAEFRTAISRAYYAVFHLARQFLSEQMQFFCNSANEHQWVQRHFANCRLGDARDAGRLIQNMHEARKDADYELSDIAIERDNRAAKLSLERAEQLKRLLRSCSSEGNIEQIKSEMLHYRKAANVQ